MKKLTLIILLFCGNQLIAATKIWDGGAGTVNWEDANNWSGNTIPSSGDSVIIKNESVELSTVQTIQSLRIEDDLSAHLTINKYGILTVDGGPGNAVLMIGKSRLSILGRLNISNCVDGLSVAEGAIELLGETSRIDISQLTGNGIFTGGTVLNEGLISVSDANYYGWENEGIINNLNQILIITTGGDGFQHSGVTASFTNTASGVFNIENANSRGINCEAYFLNEGLLEIENTASTGLSNFNNTVGFVNSGHINIYYADVDAVKNWGTGSKFTNLSQGHINVSYAGVSAVFTSNYFRNYGDIEIHQCGLSLYNFNNADSFFNSGRIFIRNSGLIQNKNLGSIFINQSGGIIDFEGTAAMLNSSKFVNEGTLKLRGCGIDNRGNSDTLFNSGVIQIDMATSGLYNEAIPSFPSIFLNQISGVLAIDSCFTGISNEQYIINKGNMTITNSLENGLNNPKYFENHGSLEILNTTGPVALASSANNSSFFVNHIGGEVNIGHAGYTSLKVNSKFKNHGDIVIENSGTYGINLVDNTDTLWNSGNLTIRNSISNAIRNTKNGIYPGLILNDVSGVINIDSTGSAAIFSSQKFRNKGHIKIDRSKSNGVYISQNVDKFINEGFLEINNSDSFGFYSLTPSIVENTISGIIQIDRSGYIGMYSSGRFLNHGLVDIKHSENYAFENRSNSDSLFNNGTIQIDSSKLGFNNFYGALLKLGSKGKMIIQNIDSIGIRNQGVMHSEACSQVYLVNGSFNTDMSPIYDTELKGLFYYQNPKPDKVTEYFEVDGVTVDVFWNLNKKVNFQSRTNIFSPLGKVSNGIKEVNITKDAPSATYDISGTWWADRNKTTSAGFYDGINNTFLPNAAGANSDSLYLEITHKTVGCKHVVALPAKSGMSCENNIYSVNFFGTASDQWLNSGNWPTYYQLPNACTKVTIPANKNAVLPANFKVRVHSIETLPSSVLDIAAGAVFETDINK